MLFLRCRGLCSVRVSLAGLFFFFTSYIIVLVHGSDTRVNLWCCILQRYGGCGAVVGFVVECWGLVERVWCGLASGCVVLRGP